MVKSSVSDIFLHKIYVRMTDEMSPAALVLRITKDNRSIQLHIAACIKFVIIALFMTMTSYEY